MRIAVGSDHRGYELKSQLQQLLVDRGHDVVDVGTHDRQSVDYTDFAEQVCCKVLRGEAARGILICGTGIGMSVTANKFPGIRAATCHDPRTVVLIIGILAMGIAPNWLVKLIQPGTDALLNQIVQP